MSTTVNAAISQNSLIKSLMWRYATKRYDSTKKISPEQLQVIKEALRLAPSSFGLQPWRFVHVADPKIREELKQAAWGQPQLTEASDIFVLASFSSINEGFVDNFVELIAKTRGVSIDSLKEYRDGMASSIKGRTPQELNAWLSRQVYIPLGVAVMAAAAQGIDATPMEGFDSKKFDQILGLDKLNLESRAILALGMRSAEDGYQLSKKVRWSEEEVFIEK